jgi:putative sterol carrier protein
MGKCGRAISFVVMYANRTEKVRAMMEGWNKTLQFRLSGEDPFYIKAENQKMKFFSGVSEAPDVILKGEAVVFFEIITGKIDQDEAYLTKKYEFEGSIMDGVKFRHLFDVTQQAHTRVFGLLQKVSVLMP